MNELPYFIKVNADKNKSMNELPYFIKADTNNFYSPRGSFLECESGLLDEIRVAFDCGMDLEPLVNIK